MKRHYSTRSFRSTGLSIRPNWPARTNTYRHTLDRTSRCREAQGCAGTAITKEFDAYLKCGRLEHGFFRVRCEACHDERLVGFSCKKRGFCSSCGARRMAESAALLVDRVLPHQPMRQLSPGMACIRAMQEQLPRVLSVPFPLRFLFASQPAVMGKVLGIVYRAIATHLTHKAGFTKPMAQTGAVTLIQRFGSALNLNIHFHMLFLDGVYIDSRHGTNPRFRRVKAPARRGKRKVPISR